MGIFKRFFRVLSLDKTQTCPRIGQVILKIFGVGYHVDHIGRLLRSLGWSPQKPQRRAIERDEAAIQRWVKADWPRVKKTPLG